MFKVEESPEIVSYWPSVSDLFMTMFIIGLAMLGAIYYVLSPKMKPGEERNVVEAVGVDMRHIRNPVNRMRQSLGNIQPLRDTQPAKEVVAGLDDTSTKVVERLKLMASLNDRAREWERLVVGNTELKKRLADLNAELNDKPPIIRIDEATTREYRFESGSAVMSREFSQGLNQGEFQTLANEILRRNAGGLLKVDTLEIIGHTDGQPIAKKGNLDQSLPAYLTGRDTSVQKMQAGSNNDLGLLRALAVRDSWNDFVNHHTSGKELRKITVRCYSAGQTIPEVGSPNDPQTFRLADKRYRRIEVRLTKLK
jgi:flagellar motor protein MotB